MAAWRSTAWFIRLTHWEYWPMWIFYFPVWLQHLWLSIRQRNLFFFLATNPAIEGFILSDSKFKTLQLVPEGHRPLSVLVQPGSGADNVISEMHDCGIGFPVILKPDVGFRGIKVKKIEGQSQLARELAQLKVPSLLQEYCEGPLETGIFYYRYPDQSSGYIPSVTIKDFLKVTGDGIHTLEELVKASPRALLQAGRIQAQLGNAYKEVLPRGQICPLELVGNHNRGTRFIDANYLVDKELLKVFDELSHQMQGFYFGRFDIRAESWEALRDRREFKIIEVNGVGGEPTHIYDSSNSLPKAWLALCRSWQIAAKIAGINFSRGVNRPGFVYAKGLWQSYRSYRTILLA